MRDSAAATIRDYLEQAQRRLELEDVTEADLEKVREKMEKADEEIQKVVEDE